jgi:anti-sigma B factor antagonist
VHRLHVEVERDGGTAVLVAGGELDAFAAPDLEAAFESIGADRVIADLGDVSFLDSTALGLLVRSVRQLRERGGQVRVVLPRGSARRIFEITTLDRALPVAGSRRDAAADLAPS